MHLAINDNGASNAESALPMKCLEPGTPRWHRALAYAEWLANERRAICSHLGVSEHTLQRTGFAGLEAGVPAIYRGEAVMSVADVDVDALAHWAQDAASKRMAQAQDHLSA